MLLGNQWVKEEIKKEIKNYLETSENGNITYQNLWDATKAVLREEFIEISAHLKKQAEARINNLTLHLNELAKEEQMKSKVSRRKEIKIRAEINEIET